MRLQLRNLLPILIFILLMLPMGSAYAQNRGRVTISGTVWDTANNETVIGATVKVKGSAKGAITDIKGQFTLTEVPVPSTLQVSFIGYKTIEIPVHSANSNLRIELKEDVQKLDELVVVGYGASTRKQDLSASVGVISNTDELSIRPVTSATSMLQGQLPGVTVQSNGGDPTGMPNLVIRGQGSQNGDNVLWVVDGVPGAPITSVTEIESIVVLKDAASAAIYGAQSGAGGVVLVTTKKAQKGEPSISYDGSFGFSNASNLPKPLNAEQQLEMRTISFKNAEMTVPAAWDPNKNPWISTTRTNWMDEIFRTGSFQRHSIALNVGTDRSANRFTASYEKNNGVLINTYSENISLRYNGSFDINKYITVGEDLIWSNWRGRSKDTNSGYTGAILSAIFMPASAQVYNPLDGSFGGTTTEDPEYIAKYGDNFASAHGDAVNPVRLLLADNILDRSNNVWSTTTLGIHNIVKGLKFNSRFSYNLRNGYYKSFSPIRDEPGKPNTNNSLDEESYRTIQWDTENTLTYDNTFGLHTLGALFSVTANHFQSMGVRATGSNFADESKDLQYMANAGKTSSVDWLVGPDANMSLVSRLSYSYDDRYFLTASWRRDYAGRLPKERNFGDFPAVTVAWKLSNEAFFPKSEYMSLLKIRGSWGRIGNLSSIPMNYRYPLLGDTRWEEQAHYGAEVNHLYNTFFFLNKVANPNLTWETSEQFNAGLDLVMFRDRLSVSMDYFNKRTFNLIQEQTIDWPTTIGLDAPLVNLGEVRNTGFELTANWADAVTKDFSYFINGNFSYLKNWVSNIGVPDAVWAVKNSVFRNGQYMIQTAEGQPLNSFYLIKTDGIFQNEAEIQAHTHEGKLIQPNAVPGDLKFVDFNNDGVINDKDRQYMGNAMPDYTYALTFGGKYKGLGLSVMLQGIQGAQALNVAKFMTLSDTEGSFNRDSRILDAWSPTNTGSKIPRISKNDPNSNFSLPSSYYLEDASYLRLKNITLSYDLTNLLRRNDHFSNRKSSMSVFLSGENLATFTKYTGMDPEVGGWDAMKYPVSRVFTLGVKLTY